MFQFRNDSYRHYATPDNLNSGNNPNDTADDDPTLFTASNLSNVEDSGDRGRFYLANDPATPSYCGINTNGAVVVNITRSPDLPDLPAASQSGTPANSYGFIRFRAKVK
jgi:hypothetical protein